MPEKNALAELAEDLRLMGLDVDGKENEILDKAQRIISELAKPIDLRTVGMTHLADILVADTNRAVEIVRNCRIIAMEGAGDGE